MTGIYIFYTQTFNNSEKLRLKFSLFSVYFRNYVVSKMEVIQDYHMRK
jgi:hypothetical protein